MSNQSGSEQRRVKAIVKKFRYSSEALGELDRLQKSSRVSEGHEQKYLGRYPTVYVVSSEQRRGRRDRLVYVGETNNILERTRQHLEADAQSNEWWARFRDSPGSDMYVIGSSHFNKSLTLDIENRLMHYVSSAAGNHAVNRRANPQGDYFSREHLDEIFNRVWQQLHVADPQTFPSHDEIRNSAVFKASPFHELTDEQHKAKQRIITEVLDNLALHKDGHLILVEGAAGTGKTVLLSSLFLSLFNLFDEEEKPRDLKVLLAVNHAEQLVVFEDIARRLHLRRFDAEQRPGKSSLPVFKPTVLMNQYPEGADIDVILVDEAHLLFTQGKQAYRGKNQLLDLLNRAKVVIAIYDPRQAMASSQYWERHPIELAREQHSASQILLDQQMRIRAGKRTQNWIRTFVDHGIIEPIPVDTEKYELRIFDSPREMHRAIAKKSRKTESALSRVIASYDWPFNGKRGPEPIEGAGTGGPRRYWTVDIGDFSMPWNLQLPREKSSAIEQQLLAWAERPETINEVGSIFTVQGFDLHYAGVILGPSIKFRDGKVVIDPSASKNKSSTNKRTLADKSSADVAPDLLRNELNVLMSRGVDGLYIYAVDDALRKELLRALSA